MALTKIGSIGINTGIAFAGVTTIATLNASDNVLSVGGTVNFVSDVSIGGTVSIAGTLTYEDVTNVDAVGLITARDGIKVGSGITLSVDGDIFATGVTTSTTFVGNLTGNVTGNSDTATNSTNASHVLVTDNESTNENNLITFVEDATSSTGNVGLEMDGNLTYNPSTGTVSATAFSGDGSALTGIGGTDFIHSEQINNSGVTTTGSVKLINSDTALNQHSVGIGTTTTTGKFAGIGTAAGTMIFNTTTSKVEVFNGAKWKVVKLLNESTFAVYYLVVGGGGAGGGNFRGGGGGAGALRTNWNSENQGGGQSSGAAKTLNAEQTYSIIIGSKGTGSSGNQGGDGGSSTFDNIVSGGGGGGGVFNGGEGRDSTGSTGGSGGGGGGGSSGGEGGESGTYGYDGGDGGNMDMGGGGGGAAGAGVQGAASSTGGNGGSSINNTITGSTVAYAGGGGAGSYSNAGQNGSGPNGAAAGGGAGAGDGMFENNGSSGYANGRDATIANRGSGGGGSSGAGEGTGGNGSDGVIILRVSSDYTPTFTSGVTYSTATVGTDKVYTITATSNSSQTVSFE